MASAILSDGSQSLKWGTHTLTPFAGAVLGAVLMCRATVDEFFEKVEKNSDYGKKLVSWHGELVCTPLSVRGVGGLMSSISSYIVGRILLRHIPNDRIDTLKSCYEKSSTLQLLPQSTQGTTSIPKRISTICGRTFFCTPRAP